jgi:hydroxyquinol 1,2-dioxygenase
MNQHQTTDITQAVLDRLSPDADPRFKQIITAVVKHAHALVREIDLQPAEWMAAIQFLTRVGQTCDEKRQEFILLSDTLGISMLVVQLEQARRSAKALQDKTANAKPTEATVQGPFYWEGAPILPLGTDIGQGMPGEPCHYSGPSPTVVSTCGRATARACTTCRWAATPACACARASIPMPTAVITSGRSSPRSTRCPTTVPWATCCVRWGATPTGPGTST